MTRLGNALVTGAALLSLDEMIAAVEAVTADDVRKVAQLLLTGPFTLAVVTPDGDLTEQSLDRYVEVA